MSAGDFPMSWPSTAHPIDSLTTLQGYRTWVCAHCEAQIDSGKSFIITSPDGRLQFCSGDCAEAHSVVEDTKRALDPDAPNQELQEFIDMIKQQRPRRCSTRRRNSTGT